MPATVTHKGVRMTILHTTVMGTSLSPMYSNPYQKHWGGGYKGEMCVRE